MRKTREPKARFETEAGSILEYQADGALSSAPIGELVIRPGGVISIDGGQLEIHLSPSGEFEVIQKTVLAPTLVAAASPVESHLDAPGSQATTEGESVVEKYYSTKEVAQKFFGKSTQWMYWAQNNSVFVHPDETPIELHTIGKGKRRRYTLDVITAMADACYRRGNIKEEELRKIHDKIRAARQDQLG
ncbi:hypothetical protein [Mycolicibacterium elephantis]|uniref:DUF7229 domain-containing protein n=1 Tax=Mycolicibacterium elephantis TaxID=81858 RepID=UPI0009EE17C0|nr:hypothetical protein [Mycolicibacterium elephantis]